MSRSGESTSTGGDSQSLLLFPPAAHLATMVFGTFGLMAGGDFSDGPLFLANASWYVASFISAGTWILLPPSARGSAPALGVMLVCSTWVVLSSLWLGYALRPLDPMVWIPIVLLVGWHAACVLSMIRIMRSMVHGTEPRKVAETARLPVEEGTWYLFDELERSLVERSSFHAIDRADRILGAIAYTASDVLRKFDPETSRQGAMRAKAILDDLRADERRSLGQVQVEAKLEMLVNVLAAEGLAP